MSKKLLGTHEIPAKAKFILLPTATPAATDKLVFAANADKSLYHGAQIKKEHIEDNAVDGEKIAMGGDAAGDLLVYKLDGSQETYQRKAIGTAGQVLTVTSGQPTWETPDLSFDVQAQDSGADNGSHQSHSMQDELRINGLEGIDVSLVSGSGFNRFDIAAELVTEGSNAVAYDEGNGVTVSDFSDASSFQQTAPSGPSAGGFPAANAETLVFSGGSTAGSANKELTDHLAGLSPAITSDGSPSQPLQLKIGDGGGDYRLFNVTNIAGFSGGSALTLTVSQQLASISGSPSSISTGDMKSFYGSANAVADAADGNKGVSFYDVDDFDIVAGKVSLGNHANGAVLAISGTSNEVDVSRSNGSVTVGLPDNVTITGNLTVNGDQFKIDGTTVQMDDSLMEMGLVGKAAPSSTTTKDLGLLLHRHDGSSAKLQFIGWNEATDKFEVKSGVTDDGDGTISGGSAAPLVAGALEASDLELSGSIKKIDGAAPAAGQLLIGHGSNGDMALATLTAGEGIDVTNADGSITIDAEVAAVGSNSSNKGVAAFNDKQFNMDGTDGWVQMGGTEKRAVYSSDLTLTMTAGGGSDELASVAGGSGSGSTAEAIVTGSSPNQLLRINASVAALCAFQGTSLKVRAELQREVSSGVYESMSVPVTYNAATSTQCFVDFDVDGFTDGEKVRVLIQRIQD